MRNSAGSPIFSDLKSDILRVATLDRWSRGTKTLGTGCDCNFLHSCNLHAGPPILLTPSEQHRWAFLKGSNWVFETISR